MDCIDTLEELVEKLDDSNPENHGRIIKKMNIPISEFEEYASWNKEGYTRNCINRTTNYELILLCWKKGDVTPIHSHDGQKCWVYQVQGKVTEVRYEENIAGELIETNRMQLNPGKLTFMNDNMGYHKLNNDTDGRAMTLHVYVSPINSCEVFNPNKEVFEYKKLKYDTHNGISLSKVN
jgi:cysteine dioxygenase